MEFLEAFSIQSWAGSLIAIIGLIISLLIYRASRIGPRPVYQFRALRLIGKEERALPEEVEIRFKNRTVPQLTKTHVILWNSGNATLYGREITEGDPIRLEFSEGDEILRVRVIKLTRKLNKLTSEIDSNSPNKVICSFDYLEAGDGAVIELLHTAEERYPRVLGTIRGVPKGLLNWGSISPDRSRIRSSLFRYRKLFYVVMLLTGVFMVGYGFFYYPIVPKEPLVPTISLTTKWFLVIFGMVYIAWPLFMLWNYRRRFPKSLAVEDVEE